MGEELTERQPKGGKGKREEWVREEGWGRSSVGSNEFYY
jgi:hypothetical protein